MRAVGTYRQLLCHSCGRHWSQVVYSYSDDWTNSRETPTCTCPTPHVEILPRPGTSSSAQCRASQRAVYYELPDGTVAGVETNSYTDPGALAAISKGGVRREIHSVHEMRRLHRDWQDSDYDPSQPGITGWGKDRNVVIDFDQPTIRSGQAQHPLRQRVSRELGEQHNPFIPQSGVGSTIRIIPGGDTYERARGEYHRRSKG